MISLSFSFCSSLRPVTRELIASGPPLRDFDVVGGAAEHEPGRGLHSVVRLLLRELEVKILEHGAAEEEEFVLCQRLAHAAPLAQAEGDGALVPLELPVLGQEALGVELGGPGPVQRVAQDVVQVREDDGALGDVVAGQRGVLGDHPGHPGVPQGRNPVDLGDDGLHVGHVGPVAQAWFPVAGHGLLNFPLETPLLLGVQRQVVDGPVERAGGGLRAGDKEVHQEYVQVLAALLVVEAGSGLGHRFHLVDVDVDEVPEVVALEGLQMVLELLVNELVDGPSCLDDLLVTSLLGSHVFEPVEQVERSGNVH